MSSSPERAKRRRLTPLRIVVGIIVLILILPVSHAIWGLWESHRFDQVMDHLRAEGEPITPADLHLDSVPAGQNASLDFKAAGKLVDVKSAAWQQWDKSTNNEFAHPLSPAAEVVVAKIVRENAPALAVVDAARGKVAGGWGDPFRPPLMLADLKMDLEPERDLVNLLVLAAEDAQSRGNEALVVDRLSEALAVADACQQRPTLVAHLVALGATALAAESVSKLAPSLRIGPDGVPRERLTALLQQLLDERAMDRGVKLEWRSERISDLDTLVSMPPGRAAITSPAATATPPTLANSLEAYLLKPIILDDAAMLTQHLDGVMRACAAPDWPAAQRRMPTQLPAAVAAPPVLQWMAGIMLPSFGLAAKVDYCDRAERRVAAAALAARLYEIDHAGRSPEKLSDLAPTYLASVPIDPVSGAPLLYKTDPPRIYSVGRDGVDDGGQPEDLDSSDAYHRHHGDIVAYLQTQPRSHSQKQPKSLPSASAATQPRPTTRH